MIALGRGLVERGHDVLLAAPENFGEWAAAQGLAFAPVGTDVERFMRDMGDAAANVVNQTRYLVRELIPLHFEKLPAICDGADLVVGAGVQFAARSVAELSRTPYAYVAYAPVTIPSAYHPPFFVRNQRMPHAINRVLWRLFGVMSKGALGRAIGQGRSRLGLPRIGDVMEHLTEVPLMLAAEPVLATPPPDFPANVHVTGALRLRSEEALDDDLGRFLDAGPAPVLLGFGSMVSERARVVMQLFARAARDVGCRLLVQTGWTGMRPDELDLGDGCRTIGGAPHPQLLPRVRAVVHHGGAGTTTAVALAGLPQLILPHLLDQYYWAHRVRVLGIGPLGKPVHRIRRRHVATLLRDLVGNDAYSSRARALTSRLGTVDGVAKAIGILERLAGERGGDQAP